MSRPCECDRFERGKPYDVKTMCRLCWLYHNDDRYKALWTDKPSLLTKAVSFGQAVVKHVTTGMEVVSDEVYESRMRACNACPFKEENSCKMCGCNLLVKAKWKTQQCPDGRWVGVSSNVNNTQVGG